MAGMTRALTPEQKADLFDYLDRNAGAIAIGGVHEAVYRISPGAAEQLRAAIARAKARG